MSVLIKGKDLAIDVMEDELGSPEKKRHSSIFEQPHHHHGAKG